MEQEQSNPGMADPMKMMKVSEKNFSRLQKFGYAGESLNKALDRVLENAEEHETKIRDKMEREEREKKK